MTENLTQNSTGENTVFGLTAKLNGDASGFGFLRSVFCQIGLIFRFKVDSDGKMGAATLSVSLPKFLAKDSWWGERSLQELL